MDLRVMEGFLLISDLKTHLNENVLKFRGIDKQIHFQLSGAGDTIGCLSASAPLS